MSEFNVPEPPRFKVTIILKNGKELEICMDSFALSCAIDDFQNKRNSDDYIFFKSINSTNNSFVFRNEMVSISTSMLPTKTDNND